MYDYLGELELMKSNRVNGDEQYVTVKFDDRYRYILSSFLKNAQEELWTPEEVEDVFPELSGRRRSRWKMKERLKRYSSRGTIPYETFSRLCEYFGENPNEMLNAARCTLIWRSDPMDSFDPYGTGSRR